ncbi:hypothetical protein M440DRAFT_132303 [Trichoderma longibrachiatum ATCC 18648]|uniref:Secreted protein n=1 Tax=Trichoderma longibrachiatum ATCC 18648 TaxID=983965 RepID=A0A2T4BVZ6_TRILO|nr:hypothetical protein M440DRAFT_132303 [Trichoderma longibrachiatum ATCC 18648]
MILVHWLGLFPLGTFFSLSTALRGQVIHSFHFGRPPPLENHVVPRTPTTQTHADKDMGDGVAPPHPRPPPSVGGHLSDCVMALHNLVMCRYLESHLESHSSASRIEIFPVLARSRRQCYGSYVCCR